jgi:hypothetical protein
MAEGNIQAKLRWKQQINESLARGDFAQAKSHVQSALTEFPEDPELLALEESVIQARDRSVQAFQLMEEGKQLCAEETFDRTTRPSALRWWTASCARPWRCWKRIRLWRRGL